MPSADQPTASPVDVVERKLWKIPEVIVGNAADTESSFNTVVVDGVIGTSSFGS